MIGTPPPYGAGAPYTARSIFTTIRLTAAPAVRFLPASSLPWIVALSGSTFLASTRASAEAADGTATRISTNGTVIEWPAGKDLWIRGDGVVVVRFTATELPPGAG